LADIATAGGTLTSQAGAEGIVIALIDVQLHETHNARLRLRTTIWDDKLPSDIAGTANTEALIAEEVAAMTHKRAGQSGKANAALNSTAESNTQIAFGSKQMCSNLTEIGPERRNGMQRQSNSHQATPPATSRGGIALAKHKNLTGAVETGRRI
jgi:hypothetical protein